MMKTGITVFFAKFVTALIIAGALLATDVVLAKSNPTATYCKVWGLLKYFHPNVRGAQMDWDSVFVTHVSPTGETDASAIDALLDAAGTPPPEWKSGEHDTTGVWQIRAIEWLAAAGNTNGLTPKQREHLRNYVQIQIPSSSLYTEAANNGNLVFETENQYKDSLYPGPAYRLLTLARYWNVVNYFYPYFDNQPNSVSVEKWDELLESYIPQVLGARDTASFHTVIVTLCNEIRDSHSATASLFLREYLGWRQLPVAVAFVENQFVIEKVYHQNTSLQAGDVIIRVGGNSVKSITDTYGKLVPASNEAARMHSICNFIGRRQSRDSVIVVYKRGDRIDSCKMGPVPTQEILMLAKHDSQPHWKKLNATTGFLDMNRLTIPEISVAMENLKDTKCLVIDLRSFTKSTVWTLAKYLGAPESWAYFMVPSLDLPGTFNRTLVLGAHPVSDAPAEPYHGKIIALVDDDTQSQGEYSAMMIRSIPGSTIIGSQTSGAASDVSSLPLIGGLRTVFSAIGVYYPDGRPTQRIGIVPDMEVRRTIDGIRNGKDEVLEAAEKLASK